MSDTDRSMGAALLPTEPSLSSRPDTSPLGETGKARQDDKPAQPRKGPRPNPDHEVARQSQETDGTSSTVPRYPEAPLCHALELDAAVIGEQALRLIGVAQQLGHQIPMLTVRDYIVPQRRETALVCDLIMRVDTEEMVARYGNVISLLATLSELLDAHQRRIDA